MPEDWVSKEFNDLMSPLELKFSRENPLIIINRMIEGPKGRKSHTGKFGVSFIRDTITGELELGHIEKGKLNIISQFIFPYPISFNTSLHARSVNFRNKAEIDQFATSLKTYTDKFDIIRTPDDSFIEKISVGLANKKFYIGIHDQLEKEKLYNHLQIISNVLNNPNFRSCFHIEKVIK